MKLISTKRLLQTNMLCLYDITIIIKNFNFQNIFDTTNLFIYLGILMFFS